MGKPLFRNLLVSLILLGSVHVLRGQLIDSNFTVSMDGIISSENTNPFWLSHNNHFTIGPETSIVGLADWEGVYQLNERAKLQAGVSGYYRNGVNTEFQRKELYLNYTNHWLRATLGAEERIDPTNGLSSTGKNFLWSPNARSFPGLLLEASEPLKIANGFTLDWGIAHYELNDDRYVSNTKVHYKRLGFDWKINPSNSINGRIQHFAQWAGTSPEYGKLDSDVKAYVDVFFATKPDSSIEGEAINALGNHLGSYFFEYQYHGAIGDLSFYHEHPFEDGSGTAFANFPDGVWGIHYILKKKNLFTGILYEYINTTNQSSSRIGYDNYFSNNIYRSGWTYERNIIGMPFIQADRDLVIDETNSPILRNRIRAHHLGLSGSLKGVMWQIKSSYVQTLPRFQQAEDPTFNYWYNYVLLSYPTSQYGTFQIYTGLDTGNQIDTIFGAGLNYSYFF